MSNERFLGVVVIFLVISLAGLTAIRHVERDRYHESLKRVRTWSKQWGFDEGVKHEKDRREQEMLDYMKQPWQPETEP
jgi:hypothetical protein